MVLEFIIELVAQGMHSILTVSKCSNCGGELERARNADKSKSIKCADCKREWVKNAQSNWQELNFKQPQNKLAK